MKLGSFLRRLLPLIALAAIGMGGAASAQNYPNRPIRLVVPFAAGGSVDTIARVLAAKLSDNFGQSVIVENRTGAGGNVGADWSPSPRPTATPCFSPPQATPLAPGCTNPYRSIQ